MNSLSKYIKQRLNIGLWCIVALILIALSINNLTLSLVQLYSIPFVVFFLFIMRLFDDLANAKFDINKTNRDYTNEKAKNELQIILIIAQIIFISILTFFDFTRALILFFFWIGNGLLYFLLFKIFKFRYYLPLLKYPFVIYILNLEPSFNLLSTYSAFLIYEMLEDPLFPFYLLSNYKASMPNKKHIPYIFLFLFLLTQITLNNV